MGDHLVAATVSGALLSFEWPSIRLVRERIERENVTCLGRGEGGVVLAGFGDGRVCRVDPATLDFIEVARFPAAPAWVGWMTATDQHPAGLVAVTRLSRMTERGRVHETFSHWMVHDLGVGKELPLKDRPKAFLLDRAGRLWLGSDRGEWGGTLVRVDLSQGTVETVKPPPLTDPMPEDEPSWEGIHGLIELRDGQVWAFGGTSHLGFESGFIARVDESRSRLLTDFEPVQRLSSVPDIELSGMPVTQMFEEADSLFVMFLNDRAFRVGKDLKSWRYLTTLDVQSGEGRPDAMGSSSSTCAVHPPTREGDPIAIATIGDGYLLLDGSKVTPRKLPGQLGTLHLNRALQTSEGMLFVERDDELPTWRLAAKGWEPINLAPPFEVDPNNDDAKLERLYRGWGETQVLAGPDGTVYTVSGTGANEGTRVTGRRVNGHCVQIGRETSSLNPSSSFITADGQLWNTSSGNLSRFEHGSWNQVSEIPRQNAYPYKLDPITTSAPWLLLDPLHKTLWLLDQEGRDGQPHLIELKLAEEEKVLEVGAAIPWTDGAILLATNRGLRAYDPVKRTLAKVDLPDPPWPTLAMVKDGLGRFWMGGADGLRMIDAGGKTLESFVTVPGLGRNVVRGLAADPQHKDGVIVLLGERGVAFLRASQTH